MGLTIVNIIILVVGAIVLGVGSGFGANAAARLTEIPNYQNNKNLSDGHNYLKIGSVVGWVTVAVLVLVGILTSIFATKAGAWKWIITIMLFLVAASSITVGVLFLLGAGKIDEEDLRDDNGASSAARTGGYMAIAAGVVVLVSAIIVIFIRAKSPTQQLLEQEQERIYAEQARRRKLEFQRRQQEAQALKLKELGLDRDIQLKKEVLAKAEKAEKLAQEVKATG